jgi:hypothetical protein
MVGKNGNRYSSLLRQMADSLRMTANYVFKEKVINKIYLETSN